MTDTNPTIQFDVDDHGYLAKLEALVAEVRTVLPPALAEAEAAALRVLRDVMEGDAPVGNLASRTTHVTEHRIAAAQAVLAHVRAVRGEGR